jgi:hypothetical protein
MLRAGSTNIQRLAKGAAMHHRNLFSDDLYTGAGGEERKLTEDYRTRIIAAVETDTTAGRALASALEPPWAGPLAPQQYHHRTLNLNGAWEIQQGLPSRTHTQQPLTLVVG